MYKCSQREDVTTWHWDFEQEKRIVNKGICGNVTTKWGGFVTFSIGYGQPERLELC